MREIEKVGVIGAGLMGHALAIVHALGGCNVIMQDLKESQIAKGLQLIDSALETLVDAGTITKSEEKYAKARIKTTLELNTAVEDADLVVEAVVENREVKSEAFQHIDNSARKDVIIASNTSNLDIFPLVPEARKSFCLIAHWYTPPYIIDLVDLAAGPDTDIDILQRMEAFYIKLGKKPVVFRKFINGYVANRLQAAMGLEITRLLDEGWASADAIDDSVKYGLALRMAIMGSLMKADFTGLDMMQRGMANMTYDPPTPKPQSNTLDELISSGRQGVMSGGGYFDYGKMTPEELFRNRDKGLLMLKSQVSDIETKFPLRPNK